MNKVWGVGWNCVALEEGEGYTLRVVVGSHYRSDIVSIKWDHKYARHLSAIFYTDVERDWQYL